MTMQRFSLSLKSRWGDEPNTMVMGLANPELLWLDPGLAPEGDLSDWILWAVHHLLNPKNHAANDPLHQHLISPAFASPIGVRMFPGFVQAFTTLADERPQADLHWTFDKGQADALYTSPPGHVINASHRLALKPTMLHPFPDNLPFGREGYGKRREPPNDIMTMEAALLMGALVEASVEDINHPVFTLLTLLCHVTLPNQPAWPGRTNNTGWTSLYNRHLHKDNNPALAWAYEQHVLRPRTLFSRAGFVRSECWDRAEVATKDHLARPFGAELASVAQRHNAFLRNALTAVDAELTKRNPHSLTLPFPHASAHEALSWTAFYTDLYAAGVRTGIFAPKGAS